MMSSWLDSVILEVFPDLNDSMTFCSGTLCAAGLSAGVRLQPLQAFGGCAHTKECIAELSAGCSQPAAGYCPAAQNNGSVSSKQF